MIRETSGWTVALRLLALTALIFAGILSILATSGDGGGGGEATPTLPPSVSLSLTEFATGLSNPVGAYNAGAGDDRLFVIERSGTIRIVQPNGTVLTTPFLNISSRVGTIEGEQGLLGLAFHPNYPAAPFFYVNYTNTTNGTRRTRISRFSVAADPNVANPNSELILLTVDQPFSNHNAGDLQFGRDGFLYIPLGDGGGGGDPSNNAQNIGLLLGKVVRIDVDAAPSGADCMGAGSGQYAIPATNPFSDGAGGTCDEIWAIGLRNPWRSSFDRLTGDYFIADVGQNAREEVNFEPNRSLGGRNYGWRCFEGNLEFNTTDCAPRSAFTFPIFDYVNPDDGCSVIGGYVYRGSLFPALSGRYFFTDFCSGNFWDAISDGAGGWQVAKHTNLTERGYVSFGEDANGELYVVHQGKGTLYRLGGL